MNTKKILIILAVIIVAFVAYAFFISGKKTADSSGVTKQAVTSTTGTQSGSAALDGPGKDFVTQLLAIQNIKFNFTLFDDAVFQGLQDWSRELVPQESGRPNPFAPIGTTALSQGASAASGFGQTFATGTQPDAASSGSGTAGSAGQAKASTTPRTTPGAGAVKR